MEVEDVSFVKKWVDLLEKQKSVLKNNSRRTGERPKDRQSRDQLVQEFMVKRMMATMQKHQGQNQSQNVIHQSFVAPPYLPSVKPFHELKQIYIKELKLETHHRGDFIWLKVLTPPSVMTAVMAIVEDEFGQGVMLQLYQQEIWTDQVVEEIVHVGGVCILKEPYFKVMNDGRYGLRIDHVSDIIWVPAGDDRVPLRWRPQVSELDDANQMKEKGNTAIKAGKVRQAENFYTLALQSSPTDTESQTIKLNRSLARLKLGLYDRSIEDAAELTKEAQKSEKGYYRAARSMYELGKFEECRMTLQHLLAEYPNCEAAKNELVRTEHRLREREHGDYDFRAMYEAANKTPPCLDQATFVGQVAVKASKGRGRGLLTTKAVAAGDLLICEKAFAYCFAAQEAGRDSSKVSSMTTLLMNTHNDRGSIGTQADLLTAVVQKLYRNLSLSSTILSMYRADYSPVEETEVDGVPIVDTFLLSEIIRLNVFGCPRKSLHSHFTKLGPKASSKAHHTTGLFVIASYINHSCFSNARRSFIGDMQIVRATRDMPAETEVFFWYAVPDGGENYEKTKENLSNWGFECTCTICLEKKKTRKPLFNRRMGFRADLTSAFNNDDRGPDIARMGRIIAAMENTYSASASSVPRLAIWDPYLLLIRIYSTTNQSDFVITTVFKALKALGFVIAHPSSSQSVPDFEIKQWGFMADTLAEVWVHLWIAYARLAPHLCAKAEAMAKACYKICVGEDVTFDEKYGEVARRAISGAGDVMDEIRKLMVY